MSEKKNQALVEKIKRVIQKIPGKKVIILGIVGIIVVVAGIGYWGINKKEKNVKQNTPMFSVNGNNEASYVTASGTTSLGYTMDEFEPDYIESELYIEEVYLSSGEEVSEGTPVLKIAEESIQEAREELTEKKEETSLAYRAGLISYEQSKINAKYTYDAAILEGQQAEAVYQSALKDAEDKLQRAKDEVTETEKKIEEYENAYTSYYYDYHLDTYKERHEQNSVNYYTFLGRYGLQESDLNGSGSYPSSEKGNQGATSDNNNDTGNGSVSTTPEDNSNNEDTLTGGSNNEDTPTGGLNSGDEGSNSGSNTDPSLVLDLFSDSNTTLARLTTTSLGDGFNLMKVSQVNSNDEIYSNRIKIAQQMKKNKENIENYYYKAWDEYEATADKAAEQLPQLKIEIESLKKGLAEAEADYQIEVLEAETTYKKALAQTELAQSDYNAAMQKAADELETLEDEKTEAQENLEEFETLLGDGYFYTQNAGTIMMVGTRKESNLQGGSMVVAYRNTEDISVTVSVAQEDIHKLEVGDNAQVMVEGYGTYEGKITYLNPVSNSGSRTNITYEVVVDLIGDNISSLKENLTATVIFE
ncbi:MAG: efflux RND transporter periplasmic adaptor subunit [Lachnospiraceae bacterium]|nr:efflux RND transporter periplasmic adaptor subunit [Lachnospiraceae bacterium]